MENQKDTSLNIPSILNELKESIVRNGGLATEGIFRFKYCSIVVILKEIFFQGFRCWRGIGFDEGGDRKGKLGLFESS